MYKMLSVKVKDTENRRFSLNMKFFMHLAKLFIRNMSIHLCRRDIFMSEKFLNRAEIGAISEKCCCEGMTNRMCRDRFYDTGFERSGSNHFSYQEAVKAD